MPPASAPVGDVLPSMIAPPDVYPVRVLTSPIACQKSKIAPGGTTWPSIARAGIVMFAPNPFRSLTGYFVVHVEICCMSGLLRLFRGQLRRHGRHRQRDGGGVGRGAVCGAREDRLHHERARRGDIELSPVLAGDDAHDRVAAADEEAGVGSVAVDLLRQRGEGRRGRV